MTESSRSTRPPENGNIRGIHHAAISVRDLDAAVAFYQATTSLKLASEQPLSPAPRFANAPAAQAQATAVLQGPNAYVQLQQFTGADRPDAQPVAVQGPGFTHLCYQAARSNALYNRCIEHGATPVSRGTVPVDLGGYGVYYAYARDADGAMFEVEELEDQHLFFDAPAWIGHVALVSPDIDRLVSFYEEMLDTSPYRRANKIIGPRIEDVTGLDNARIRAAWIDTPSMVLEIWEYVIPATPSAHAPRPYEALGYNHFSFEVLDLDTEFQRLQALGVDIVSAPSAANESGARSAYARDPDGNLFGLVQLAPDSALRLDTRTPMKER